MPPSCHCTPRPGLPWNGDRRCPANWDSSSTEQNNPRSDPHPEPAETAPRPGLPPALSTAGPDTRGFQRKLPLTNEMTTLAAVDVLLL